MNKNRTPSSWHALDLFRRQIPDATLKRLVYYARCVRLFREQGHHIVLSEEIGRKCGVHGAVVRKDFSFFGEFGVRGRGYDVVALDNHLESLFDSVGNFFSILVGVGRLGHAIADHVHSSYKTRIVAAFDRDADRCAISADIPVLSMTELPQVVRDQRIQCAILAIPSVEVQAVVDQLVDAGIRIILSLALRPIQVPDGVSVGFLDVLSEVEYLFLRHSQREEST